MVGMKKFILSSLILSLLAGCGLPDSTASCGESEYQEYSVKGDFLLDHGERIAFAPKCYYDPTSPDLKCGLAAVGVETSKTLYQSSGNMDCPSVAQGVHFNYNLTDFSKLVVMTSDGTSKPLLSYSYLKTAYKADYNNARYGVSRFDYYASFNSFNEVDSDLVQTNVIECDSLGVVDFSIKDAKGTKIHVKYDMSYFIDNLRTGIKINDDDIYIFYLGEYTSLDTTECFFRNADMNRANGYDTRIITNSHAEECLNQCSNCNEELPVARIEYSLSPYGSKKESSLYLTCESEPEIQDSVPQILTIYGYEDVYCKAVRIIPYIDEISMPECQFRDVNCLARKPRWGNVFYKTSRQ